MGLVSYFSFNDIMMQLLAVHVQMEGNINSSFSCFFSKWHCLIHQVWPFIKSTNKLFILPSAVCRPSEQGPPVAQAQVCFFHLSLPFLLRPLHHYLSIFVSLLLEHICGFSGRLRPMDTLNLYLFLSRLHVVVSDCHPISYHFKKWHLTW